MRFLYLLISAIIFTNFGGMTISNHESKNGYQLHPGRVKQYVHSVRIYPPPAHQQKKMLREQLTNPIVNRIPGSFRIPLDHLPIPTTSAPGIVGSSRISAEIRRKPLNPPFHTPQFPRLLELPPIDTNLFPPNASLLPSYMTDLYQPPSQIAAPTIAPQMVVEDQMVSPRVLDKEQVLRVAGRKQKFGVSRFSPIRNMYPTNCVSGWCGGECCDTQHPPISTTIQATALPGSATPPHPLVLVVHPAPMAQCSPDCQPQCLAQCVSRVQYLQESQYFNSIQQPMCRPDCMPLCHVECLIIPPERVRCNNFRCQCAAGYVQCAAFTCCMRYPSMVAKMRANASDQTSEERAISSEEQIAQHSPPKGGFKDVGVRAVSHTNPMDVNNITTTTTTTLPPSTTMEIKMVPIYAGDQKIRRVPLIPAYEMWSIPEGRQNGAIHHVGDIRGRHVIRSENFLDVLGQLAQLKLKEDIRDDFSHAQSLIDIMTENINKS